MEGDPEDSEEDAEAQDRSHSAVLWEKCIQQSIFVDLSEDESLRFSDLEGSFVVRLSQPESAVSEASIHLSGSAELSALGESSSDCNSSGHNEEENLGEDKRKRSVMHVSAPGPPTIQGEQPLTQEYEEDPGQNTSDEDQDDLPYDGNEGSPGLNHTASTEKTQNASSDGGETPNVSPGVPRPADLNTVDGDDNIMQDCSPTESSNMVLASRSQEQSENRHDDSSQATECPPMCSTPVYGTQRPDVTQLLLRHFSQDELLCSGRLIEAETLPEVSLLESTDETLSRALNHNTTDILRNSSSHSTQRDGKQCFSRESDGERSHAASEIPDLCSSNDSNVSDGKGADSDQGSDPYLPEKEEDEGEEGRAEKAPLVRARSFGELKYGQGQVHYPLPDFSKVAPKVKIPKIPSGPTIRPAASQGPTTIHRAQSSPGMLDVISRVLEDSVQAPDRPYVFQDQGKLAAPATVHHLQAEYDKLLTKYAEAENLIDQMRLGNQAQASSDHLRELDCGDYQGDLGAGILFESLAPPSPPAEILGGEPPHKGNNEPLCEAAFCRTGQQAPSDGERMTAELGEIIRQFMHKVEEFKVSLNSATLNTEEQQMMLRSMMAAQDQLEREYIHTKEEHRALEMQNYIGLSGNTGTFDPDRLLEGDIFRTGMILEDVKETIDRNVCNQLSPPHCSSSSSAPTPTPTPHTHLSLGSPPGHTHLPAPSPPPSQHRGWSAASEKWTGKEQERDASEKDTDCGSEPNNLIVTSDSAPDTAGHSSHPRISSGVFPGGQDSSTAEDDEDQEEEERSSSFSEGKICDDILERLTRTRPSSRQTRWTPESLCTQDGLLSPDSLAVEFSRSSDALKTQNLSRLSLSSTSTSPRIVSPETDSGFGSSDLSQPDKGAHQPKLLTDSVLTQNDGLIGSDSEGSCSNLQTAIHPPPFFSGQHGSRGSQAGTPRASPKSQYQTTPSCGAASAVELWVESTMKEPAVGLHDPLRQLHHHLSEPVLSTSMDTAHQHKCPCNSDVIMALQSEVSRLKKDLEEGLVQLPHLSQKMDYLASKYQPDRQDRRSKTRPRSQQRKTSGSACKPLSLGSTPSSAQVKIEDWISSDMDPRKREDSGEADNAPMTRQFHGTPVGGRRGSNALVFSSEVPGTPQGKKYSNRGSEENCSVRSASLTHGNLKTGERLIPYTKSSHRALSSPKTVPAAEEVKSVHSKGRLFHFSPLSHVEPLLQVNYGSSSSLPASYKVREAPLPPASSHRKRSTQSDTALLPSDVYFLRTLSPTFVSSRTGGRAGGRRRSKEEEMSRTLDRALEAARSMKRTTERMARSLSGDLLGARLSRKLQDVQPQ